MIGGLGDDRGSVTAEFAVVVPAVLAVVALTVGALSAAGRQVRLEQGAAQAARLIARGESEQRARAAAGDAGAITVHVEADADTVCVQVGAPSVAALPLPPLQARSCALSGGR